MLKVKRASYLSGYKLKIAFSNGKTKVVDFEKWIFGKHPHYYLDPLKDVEFFKQFEIDESGYSICWPNDADFSPEVLYEAGKVTTISKLRKSKPAKPKRRKVKSSKVRG